MNKSWSNHTWVPVWSDRKASPFSTAGGSDHGMFEFSRSIRSSLAKKKRKRKVSLQLQMTLRGAQKAPSPCETMIWHHHDVHNVNFVRETLMKR